MKLAAIEPKEVLGFFEEISAIPRGSGNTEAIADYLVGFAKNRELAHIRDGIGNVVIFQNGTKGYENSEPLIIQGHMDMVCEKDNNSMIDMKRDGLDLYVEDGFVRAHHTSLGGDDGIALAYVLAIMDSDMPHPPIEAVFTVDEEVGMGGASAFDASVLRGKRLLNIDSEVEGVFTAGCAGGANVNVMIPTERVSMKGRMFVLTIEGLRGGHSGMDIDKGRANSNLLMARLLYTLRDHIKIFELDGGTKGNAIPIYTKAVVVSDMNIADMAAQYDRIYKEELASSDPDVEVTCSDEGMGEGMVCANTEDILSFLIMAPNGVCSHSMEIEGLVESSLNLGVLSVRGSRLTALYTVRSSVRSKLKWLCQQINAAALCCGGELIIDGVYLPWKYRKDSPLRKVMTEIYTEQYGREPVVDVIHAGLECGIFEHKIKGLDAVSIGPNILDIHTTRERLDIASVERVWKFIKELLKRLK